MRYPGRSAERILVNLALHHTGPLMGLLYRRQHEPYGAAATLGRSIDDKLTHCKL